MSSLPPTAPARPHAIPPAAPAPARTARTGRSRVRWSMYIAFALLAALALFQARYAHQVERLRAADAEIIHLAGLQTAFAQEMGRMAALTGSPSADLPAQIEQLAVALDRSRSEALLVEALLKAQRELAPGETLVNLRALEAWQVARERLWYRGEALLRHLGATDMAAASASTHALQAEVQPALQAADRFTEGLRSRARAHSAEQVQMVQIGVAATLLLLALLALGVVEPASSAVDRQMAQLALQAAELERLALVAERTHNMVMITDRQDRVLWANDAFTRMSGYTLAEALGRLPGELLHHPDSNAEQAALLRDALARGVGMRMELLCQTRDGQDLWLDVDLQPLLDADGQVAGFCSVDTDITAQVTERLRTRTLLATLPAGVVVQAAGGEVVDINRSAEAMLGAPAGHLLGRRADQLQWRAVREDLSDYAAHELPQARTLRSGLAVHGETLGLQLPNGQQRWLLVNTEPLTDRQGGQGVLSCFLDVTEQRRLQEQLRELARTDALTGLPNRAVVLDRVQRAISHAQRHPGYGFAVLFMDFDRFKQVNDTLGHTVGDELLRQIATRLQATLRPGDALGRVDSQLETAARIGGDEFVVVLEGTRSQEDLQQVTERLLELLSLPYQLGPHQVQSGVSIGVVASEHAADTADAVLRDADTAMYEAKRAGRGRCVFFDASMHDRVVQMLAIETDLRRALRDDELFVVYQPVIELASGALAGVEALVRWQHPTRGLVPPVQFIGVAEEAGLIDAIGDFVLRSACAQFARWRIELGAAAPRQMAVNLSRAQLQLPGLVPEVQWILEHNGMQPFELQLEVTESLAAQDDGVKATLRALKALGVQLALDDFGTGYSSLACLNQLPVGTVKIDRCFVEHAETENYQRVLIEATVKVASELGMTLVAEGIETAGQARLMQALGCHRGQGYLFGRPMTAAALAAWALPALSAEQVVDTNADADADTIS